MSFTNSTVLKNCDTRVTHVHGAQYSKNALMLYILLLYEYMYTCTVCSLCMCTVQAFECGFYSVSALYEVYQLVRQHLSKTKPTDEAEAEADEEMDAVGEGLHFTRYALVLPFAIVRLHIRRSCRNIILYSCAMFVNVYSVNVHCSCLYN